MKRELACLFAIVTIGACSYDPPTPSPDGPDGLTVGFATGATLVDELSTAVEIPVQLSVAGNATVDYSVTAGNATRDTDFTLTDGTLTFSGSASAVIDLSIVSDALEEPDETIEITLSNPTGAALVQPSHVVTISSDILPRVKFMVGTTSGPEATPAALDVVLDLPPKAPVSVTLALSGTALGGTDYSLANDTVVTFDINETVKQVPLAVVTDDLDEDDEDVIAALTLPTGLVIDTTISTTTHTILDDDLPPTVQFDAASSNHPEATSDASQTVSLSGASGKTITVEYRQTSGAAAAADFTLGGTGTLTFLPGQTTQPVPIAVAPDTLDEADVETAVITLENPTNVTIGTPDFSLNILDDDNAPTVSFTTPTTTVTEGTTTITVGVQLSAASGLPITVQFARDATSSAVVTGDFTFVTTSPLSFPAGTTTQDITITVANDLIGELDETLIINLASPVNATLAGTIVHTVTIGDNDCLGTGAFKVCPAAAPAGNVTLNGTVNTSGGAPCAAAQPVGWNAAGQDDACFVIAANITVPNAGVTVTGSRPLVLVASNTISITGSLNASANATTDGNGAPSSLCKTFPGGAAESNSNGGGGGAGATFMSKGGNGGDGNASDNNSDGGNAPTIDAADPVQLRAGCAGQDGGDGNGGDTAGVGGGAGGAVYLLATTINISGSIDVSGGGGTPGSADAGGGAGGGTGGMILLDATTVNATGTLIANGGGGGQGADDNTTGGPGGEPSVGQPLIAAPGGNVGNAGGPGGAGAIVAVDGVTGTDGGGSEGAGGGGGGGGFIKSSGTIAGTASAGKIVQP